VLCLAMAGVAIKTMTPIYESVGEIRVVVEMTSSRLIEDESRRFRRPQDLDRATLTNIWNITTSPKFLELVARETRLYEGRAQLPQGGETGLPDALTPDEMRAVRRGATHLRGKIRVRQSGEQLFEIGVRDIDPEQTYILARVVLDRFLDEERATRMAPRTATRDFLERQRSNYESALKAAEDSLAAFQRSLVTETLVGNPINATNLAAAESNLLTLQDQYYNADVNEMARLEQLVRAIVGNVPSPAGPLRDPEIVAVLQLLRELELSRLLGSTSATLGNELGQARVRLNSLVEARVDRDYAQLGLMDRNRLTQYMYFMVYREAKGRVIEILSRHIRNYRDFTTRQPVQSARLAELQDEVTNRRNLLDSIEREITQQTINLEASLAEVGYRIEVRRDPRPPYGPVEPDKIKLAFMAFVLSVALGFGLVVLSVLLDRSFTSVGDIEKALRLTVIGTLPVIQDEHFKRKRRLRLLRWGVIVAGIVVVAAVFLLYIYPRLS
jgi:uncharacterized protein involved in exopolysaccharide biosynthesis